MTTDSPDATLGRDATLRSEILDLARRLERRGFRFEKMPATGEVMRQREHLDTVSVEVLTQARDELRASYDVIMGREQGVVHRIRELKRTRIAAVVVALLAGVGTTYGVQQLQPMGSREATASHESASPSLAPALQERGYDMEYGHGTVRTLTDANFETQISHGFWVVDFGAEWCKPCKGFAPVFEAMASLHGRRAQTRELHFARFNVDPNNDGVFNEIAQKFQVGGIPSVLFFKDGKVVARARGQGITEEVRHLLARFGY